MKKYIFIYLIIILIFFSGILSAQIQEPEWVGMYEPDLELFIKELVEGFGMKMEDMPEDQLEQMREEMGQDQMTIELKADFTFIMYNDKEITATGIMIEKGNNTFELKSEGYEDTITITIENNQFTTAIQGIGITFFKVG